MTKRKQKVTQQDMKLAWLEAFIERHGGRASPRAMFDDAHDPSCPFHDDFEWDVDVAAEQHNLSIAAGILRRWKGVILKIDAEAKIVKVEAVRRVQSPAGQRTKGGSSYETIEQIMADPEKREDMVQTVLRELSAYRKRYAQLVALADVWRAIDEAIELHKPEPKPVAADEARATS